MTDADGMQRLRDLVVDLEVRRLVFEYAATIDARDWDGLAAVLADDVVVEYHNGRTVVSGATEVVAYVRENTQHLAWQHHLVSPYAVTVDGDTASGRTYLLSHQAFVEDAGHIITMAAFYDNEYTCASGRWQIARMKHTIAMTNHLPLTADAPSGLDIPPAVAP